VEAQFRRTHGLPSAFPSVSAWTKAMLEPFASAFSSQPLDSTPSAASAPESHNAAELQRLVRNLQAEVDQLKKRPAGKRVSPRRKPR
jgi:hypothetical protein